MRDDITASIRNAVTIATDALDVLILALCTTKDTGLNPDAGRDPVVILPLSTIAIKL